MEFEEFARARTRPLLRLAYALTSDRGLAEDIAQDVLIKVHRQWTRVANADNPDSYVNRMLVNEVTSWRRRWARIIPVAQVLTDDEPDPAAAHAERDALRRDIAKLPRRQQVVLGLRYYAGLTDAEIADAMGCSAGTVRGYVSRALSTLRLDLTARTVTDSATITKGRLA